MKISRQMKKNLIFIFGFLILGFCIYLAAKPPQGIPANLPSAFEDGLPPMIGEPSSYQPSDTSLNCNKLDYNDTQHVTISIINPTHTDVELGVDYELEIKLQGTWHTLVPYTQREWPAIAHIIPAEETFSIEYDLSDYGLLEAGYYRLVISSGLLISEFQIN